MEKRSITKKECTLGVGQNIDTAIHRDILDGDIRTPNIYLLLYGIAMVFCKVFFSLLISVFSNIPLQFYKIKDQYLAPYGGELSLSCDVQLRF